MEQFDLLKFTVGILENLRLRYFVTGSTATILYGEPRFTNDIDMVVDLPGERIGEFCRSFPPQEFYLSEDTARQAVSSKGQFNIIQPATGLKVDVIVPAQSAFNQSRFARARRLKTQEAFEANFASPEDVIIKKMEYYGEGQSEKHLRDIRGILKISNETIDRPYIQEWSRFLGLEDIWRSVSGDSPGA